MDVIFDPNRQQAPGAAGGGAPADVIKDGDQRTFMADVVEASRQVPVLVDFWATWCPSCKALEPQITRLAAQYGNRLQVITVAVSVNQTPERVRRYVAARRIPGTVVFDRGVPDVVGFLRVSKLPVAPRIDGAARRHRYNPRVFLAPFWAEIYTHDPERIQPPELARATEAVMRDTYAGYGYRLVELPRASVAERVAFVLRHLELA